MGPRVSFLLSCLSYPRFMCGLGSQLLLSLLILIIEFYLGRTKRIKSNSTIELIVEILKRIKIGGNRNG